MQHVHHLQCWEIENTLIEKKKTNKTKKGKKERIDKIEEVAKGILYLFSSSVPLLKSKVEKEINIKSIPSSISS